MVVVKQKEGFVLNIFHIQSGGGGEGARKKLRNRRHFFTNRASGPPTHTPKLGFVFFSTKHFRATPIFF